MNSLFGSLDIHVLYHGKQVKYDFLKPYIQIIKP
jgi:hypothetical protein